MKYIPVSFDEIPVRKRMMIQGIILTFEVHYNDLYDFFTLYIFKKSKLLLTTKLIYGKNCIDCIVDGIPEDFAIVPLSKDEFNAPGQVFDRLGKDNFDQVRMYVTV